MKTTTKLAITFFTTALLAASGALAGDSEWATFSTGNAKVTYRRPSPKEATVAVNVHGKAIGRPTREVKNENLRSNYFQTANGPVSYFSPAR